MILMVILEPIQLSAPNHTPSPSQPRTHLDKVLNFPYEVMPPNDTWPRSLSGSNTLTSYLLSSRSLAISQTLSCTQTRCKTSVTRFPLPPPLPNDTQRRVIRLGVDHFRLEYPHLLPLTMPSPGLLMHTK